MQKLQLQHLEIIADFMSENIEFARGRLTVSNARQKFRELWMDLAKRLNAAGLGEKSVEKWQKVSLENLQLKFYQTAI